MKLRIYGMVLSLFFALGLVFSFGVEASASHGDGTGKVAKDVVPTNEEDVKAFLAHINEYYNKTLTDNMSDPDALNRELIIYGRDIRREGDYKNSEKNLYSMGINARGFVTNHAGYPQLLGYKFNQDASGSEVASVIKALIAGSTLAETICQTYGDDNRVACAHKVFSPQGNVTTIAGLHHAEKDPAFSLPDCSEFALTTTPEAVFDDPTDDNLEAYVKGVIDVSQKLIAKTTAQVLGAFIAGGGDLPGLANPDNQKQITDGVSQRLFDKVACFGSEDAKHQNIYAFIMDANPAVSTVLFNGNNFDLNGGNLDLVDKQLKGEQNIAKLFNKALGDDRSVGNTAYVSYHWDDPTTADDDVPNWFEDGVVPGTSCKRSYIEVGDLNGQAAAAVAAVIGGGLDADTLKPYFPPQPYIFGSGTYPGDDACAVSSDDDGGCAIAGTGHTVRSTALNLLLAASVLFSVVFLRKRV